MHLTIYVLHKNIRLCFCLLAVHSLLPLLTIIIIIIIIIMIIIITVINKTKDKFSKIQCKEDNKASPHDSTCYKVLLWLQQVALCLCYLQLQLKTAKKRKQEHNYLLSLTWKPHTTAFINPLWNISVFHMDYPAMSSFLSSHKQLLVF